jgi:hypothetical protein
MRNFSGLVFSFFVAALTMGPMPAQGEILDASAELVLGAQVTQVDPLSFGKFTVGPAGGTIQVNAKASGIATATGDVALLGNLEQRGVVNILAPKGADIEVTVGDTTLTEPNGQTMRVVDVTCVERGNPSRGSCNFKMQPAGNADIGVGGTLVVLPNQRPGLYQGVIVVTANVLQ